MSRLNWRPGWCCCAPWLSLKHLCFLSFFKNGGKAHSLITLFFFFLIFIWLRWVLVVAHGIFVAVCEISLQHIDSNGGTPISNCSERAPEPHGFSSCSVRALELWCVGSVVAPSQMGSLFPNRGSNPRPLHCKVSS